MSYKEEAAPNTSIVQLFGDISDISVIYFNETHALDSLGTAIDVGSSDGSAYTHCPNQYSEATRGEKADRAEVLQEIDNKL